MSILTDAISWSGTDVTLLLFVVSEADQAGPSLQTAGGTTPARVRRYDLPDPDERLGDRTVHEYDLTFDHLPEDLDTVVAAWLTAAIRADAVVGWFAFEGSFHFDHVLTPDIADQVYAVADRHDLDLALDDARREGGEWAAQVAAVRRRLLPG